jgi:hypothetical protein
MRPKMKNLYLKEAVNGVLMISNNDIIDGKA